MTDDDVADSELPVRDLVVHLRSVVARDRASPERTRRADDELARGLAALLGTQFEELVGAWRRARAPEPCDPDRSDAGARRADVPALAAALGARAELWRSPDRQTCAMDLLSAVVAMGYDVVRAPRGDAA